MKWIYVFLFFALCAIFFVSCLSAELDVKKPGTYEMKLSASRETMIRCSIDIVAYTPAMHRDRCWGSDWNDPHTIVASIKLWANKSEITVPLSSYADISNANLAELTSTLSGYRLTIQGGDAATSYEEMLDFCESSVLRRRVKSGEFPDQGWEMTIYWTDVVK
jgi:hypothetical protein